MWASLVVSSPNKTEFIKAKYQMLVYVHRMPCREDDSVTANDLSKVRNGCFWIPLAIIKLFFKFPAGKSHLSLSFGRVDQICDVWIQSNYLLISFSATPLQCSDWKSGDLPTTLISGSTGQLLPSSGCQGTSQKENPPILWGCTVNIDTMLTRSHCFVWDDRRKGTLRYT